MLIKSISLNQVIAVFFSKKAQREATAPNALETTSERAVKWTSDDPARYRYERRIWKNVEAIIYDFVARSSSVNLDSVLKDLNETQVIVQRVEVRLDSKRRNCCYWSERNS